MYSAQKQRTDAGGLPACLPACLPTVVHSLTVRSFVRSFADVVVRRQRGWFIVFCFILLSVYSHLRIS